MTLRKKKGLTHCLNMKRTIDDVSDIPAIEAYDFNRLPPELVRALIGHVRPAIPGHSPQGLAVNHFKVHLNLSHTCRLQRTYFEASYDDDALIALYKSLLPAADFASADWCATYPVYLKYAFTIAMLDGADSERYSRLLWESFTPLARENLNCSIMMLPQPWKRVKTNNSLFREDRSVGVAWSEVCRHASELTTIVYHLARLPITMKIRILEGMFDVMLYCYDGQLTATRPCKYTDFGDLYIYTGFVGQERRTPYDAPIFIAHGSPQYVDLSKMVPMPTTLTVMTPSGDLFEVDNFATLYKDYTERQHGYPDIYALKSMHLRIEHRLSASARLQKTIEECDEFIQNLLDMDEETTISSQEDEEVEEYDDGDDDEEDEASEGDQR